MTTLNSATVLTSDGEITDPYWWRRAVVYQIYPRSFADANGDGLGDLNGITSRVPYLRDLGVDAVWLSPFYPSALADGGYDVDDYRNVDPRLGTLEEFDAMVAALHEADIKVVVDIVPNHSSDRHEWFQEALASAPGSPARERYIFRDGKGADGSEPPSDWQSLFGGPAWERVPDGQWYLHLFAKEQPDLNWDNPEIRADFERTIRFWSDRGVDGFRVDVAHALTKDMSEPMPSHESMLRTHRDDGSHPWWDHDDVHEIYRGWRKVFAEYQPPRFGVAEAGVHPSRRAAYASLDGLGQCFNFDLLEADWDASALRGTINEELRFAQASGASMTWVLSNHDVPRHATRYGFARQAGRRQRSIAADWLRADGKFPDLDRELGTRRARAAALLLLALPGSAYVYQGEELGLHEVGDLPREVLQDPIAHRSDGKEKGRDGCRVPLPWTPDQPSLGFGATASHLPQPAWFAEFSVERQRADATSMLALYRQALALRPQFASTDAFDWVDRTEEIVHFTRSARWHVVTNFGAEPCELPEGHVVLSSVPLIAGLLPSDATAWVRGN